MADRRAQRVLVGIGIALTLLIIGWVGFTETIGRPEPPPEHADIGLTAGTPPTGAAGAPVAAVSLPTQRYPAHTVATGTVAQSFKGYGRLGPSRIVLANPEDDKVRVTLLEYRNGAFEPTFTLAERIGQLQDVGSGPLYNDAQDRSVVVGNAGILVIDAKGAYRTFPLSGYRHALIGDWDGDGTQETVLVRESAGAEELELWRYSPDGMADQQLAWLPGRALPAAPAPTDFARKGRRVLMGLDVLSETPVRGFLPFALYTIDARAGLEQLGRYTLPDPHSSPAAALATGTFNGVATLLVSHRGLPSFIAVYELNGPEPSPRGRIALPAGKPYVLIPGSFSRPAAREVLAITPEGDWVILEP